MTRIKKTHAFETQIHSVNSYNIGNAEVAFRKKASAPRQFSTYLCVEHDVPHLLSVWQFYFEFCSFPFFALKGISAF